ncbi:MAG TPA: SDR family oxidoreductase [Armatimonadota bacterium]|jgi:uncharacterized protein YbjT (DUF2867 family)
MILVTGASGTVGTEVSNMLAGAEIEFRAIVHRTEKPKVFRRPNVQSVHADYEDPGSILNAMQNVDTVFMLAPAGPKMVDHERAITDAAIRSGVRRIIKLSVFGASPFSPISIIRNHWYSEKYVEHSGIQFTFVRPNYFMQNLLRQAANIATERKIYAAMNGGRVSMIDARDIAAVAVALLRKGGYENRVVEITGREGITYEEAAEDLSGATGRHISFVNMSMEQFQESLQRSGMPQSAVEDMVEFQKCYRAGYAAAVTPFVELITGHESIPFAQFAHDYADEFTGEEMAAA